MAIYAYPSLPGYYNSSTALHNGLPGRCDLRNLIQTRYEYMDGKGDRRLKEKMSARRRKGMESYRQQVSKFLSLHKRSLLSSILLIIVIILLFGILGRFPAPASNTVPNGVNVVSYSAFVDQVQADNVLAVTFQGDGVYILLANPYGRKLTTTAPTASHASRNDAAEVTAWSRYVGAEYPGWPNTSVPPPVNPALTLYALLPARGDASLMQSLLHKHITIGTLPVVQSPVWLTWWIRR